jgi:hypothetical protein
MNKADGQDTANRLSAIVANSLDTQAKTQDLARQAYQSRTQLHRLFRTVVEETPAAMRRRLLLERAAYQLAHTGISVTNAPWTPTTVRWRRSLGLSGKLFGFLPAFIGVCVIRTFTCRRPTTFTFVLLVPQQKEEETWIYSIVLQATTPGTRGVCWNTRVL